MIHTLVNMADVMVDASERLAVYGIDPTPEAVAVLYAAIDAADSYDPDAGAMTGNAGKLLAAYVARCETFTRTARIEAQTSPSIDTGTPIDLTPTGEWDDTAFHAAVTEAQSWAARNHDVVVKRTSKGAATSEVKRRGVAFVIGDAGDVPTIIAMSARQGRQGWDAIGVTRATNYLYGDVIDPLLGSETMTFSEIVPGDVSSLDVHGVAVHSTDATGYLTMTSADRDIMSGPARGGGRKVTAWPTRTTIRKPVPRKGEDWGEALICGTGSDDRIHVGNVTVARPPAKHARKARAARTVGAYRADTLATALAALETLTIDPGKRVTFTGDGWDVTVRRSMAAKKAWHARVKRDGIDPVEVRNASSKGALATRIAVTIG